MKKLLLSLLSCSLLWGTISNNVQFNVRTDGNDSNSGGFVTGATGTDFSQQAAAQYTFSDLASANGTTNPCVVTSASHNFVAADVGNLMNITAGTNWLTGSGIEYQIVSAAANAATLDRACGSVAALSAGTFFVGGAKLTWNGAVVVADSTTSMAGGASAGAMINIRTGTYTITATINVGANTNIAFTGYGTNPGDNGACPTLTTATNSTNLLSGNNRSFTYDNICFTNTAATPAIGINYGGSGPYLGVRNSSFSGFTNGINSGSTLVFLNRVEIKNSTLQGFLGGTTTVLVTHGSWIHNNTGNQVATGIPVIVNSIVSNGTAQGVNGNASPSAGVCLNSDISLNGTVGWNVAVGSFALDNCIISSNGTFGVVGPGIGAVTNVIPVNIGQNNGFFSNTSGDLSNYTAAPGTMNGATKALNDLTFSSSPYTSGTNFALNNSGGAAAKGTGSPGAFPTGATNATTNIGAVQNSPASGGGGGGVGAPQMIGTCSASFQ